MAFIKRQLKPFPVPEGVYEEANPGLTHAGIQPLPFHRLPTLPRETIEELCDEFRLNVFRAANIKPDDDIRF